MPQVPWKQITFYYKDDWSLGLREVNDFGKIEVLWENQ